MKLRIHPSLRNLLIILAVMLIGLSTIFPIRVLPATATPQKFSAERALTHLFVVARESHPSGSPAQAVVRDYLVQQLTALGLEVDVQKVSGADNVAARLKGTNPTGAIVLLAHYDSSRGPGAADNGSGTAALLEIMRALVQSPAPRNDIIALFDDGEELPDEFTGTKAFVRKHPWMADVRVAVGMDTAARGFISTNDTGLNNGWMVAVMARAYTSGAWTSLSGGGNYDTQPFKSAGVQVLELEDNYPFVEQHTPNDIPELVNPGSLQQLGEQALSVMRELGSADLQNIRGVRQAYLFVPYLFLLHYPESWTLPLAVLAAILTILAFVLAIKNKLIRWKGFGVAVLVTLSTAGLAAVTVNAIWKAVPKLLKWNIRTWPEWPEVIPPNGWLILVGGYLIILVLCVAIYRLTRRWSSLTSFSLLGLMVFMILALTLSLTEPRGAIIFTWPVMIGSGAWIAGLSTQQKGRKISSEFIAMLASLLTAMYIVPLLISIFMGDGTKSVAITAAVWVFTLAIILPGLDGLITRSN